MFHLTLLRHCQYDNPRGILPGRLPVPLSAEGREEAKRLHQYFKDQSITQIYSSAVVRCRETADFVAQGVVPITYDQRLLETFSAYQGFWIEDWRYFFGMREQVGGESNADVQARLIEFYQQTPWQDGHEYLIVSHGDPLHFLYQHLVGQPLLPEITMEDTEPPTPDDYLPKGAFRRLTIDDNTITAEPMVTQSELASILAAL